MKLFKGIKTNFYLLVLTFFGTFLILSNVFAKTPQQAESGIKGVGLGLALLGGFIQLILGIALAVASISIGIHILNRVLPEVKVTDALKAKNSAVGVMTAGVVIAYTKVISTGITQIGESISIAPSVGAFIGGCVNVIIGIALASLAVTWAFIAFSKVTAEIKLAEELNNNNLAVGVFIAGVLFGISEMIAAAVSGIGQALASALTNMI